MYLVQDHSVLPDFCYEALKAAEYQNWLNPGSAQVQRVRDFDFSMCLESDSPIGSLEFVREFFAQKIGITSDPRPLNIPSCLHDFEFVKRKIWNDVTLDTYKNLIEKVSSELFIKSAVKYKDFVGEVVNRSNLGNFLTKYSCLDISEVVDFRDEWRVFVHNYEYLDLKCYSGKFVSFPENKYIENVISTLKLNIPDLKSYVIDVGSTELGYAIVEVHPFVSCGLYGFREYKHLLSMFMGGIQYWKKNIMPSNLH